MPSVLRKKALPSLITVSNTGAQAKDSQMLNDPAVIHQHLANHADDADHGCSAIVQLLGESALHGGA